MMELLRPAYWLERMHRFQWGILAVAVALIGLLSLLLVLQPAWQRYQEVEQDLERHQAEMAQAQVAFAGAQSSRRLWDKLKEQYGSEVLAAQSSDEREMAVLAYFSRVQTLARDAGVQLQDINQAGDPKEAPVDDRPAPAIEQRLVIHVQGGYDNLARFVQLLAAQSRGARVDGSVVVASDSGQAERLDMTIKVTLLFFSP